MLYTKEELKQHAKMGDVTGPLAESGFRGHPQCRFCRKSFYGDNELFSHMQQNHEQCHLCRRARPDKYIYYRDYAELDGALFHPNNAQGYIHALPVRHMRASCAR